MARIHAQHRVALQLEEGLSAEALPPDDACAHSTAMTFQCSPAFAPQGARELPFAAITMRFANAQRGCEPSCHVRAAPSAAYFGMLPAQWFSACTGIL